MFSGQEISLTERKIVEYTIIIVTNPGYELPSTHRQRSLTHHKDSCTTQTVTCHSGLQFPSSIALIAHTQLNALITQLSSITRSPKSYYTHYIRPTPVQSAEYSIAYITFLAIATLRSPLSSHSLPCLFSPALSPACVSRINPLPVVSDSVCTSLGLLLVYLNYLSALPCWILFADRRPTLALGLLYVLPVLYLFAIAWTLLILCRDGEVKHSEPVKLSTK